MYNEVVNNYAIHPEKYGAKFDKDALGWKYLQNFMKWCKKRDVKVIFMPSTLLRNKKYFNDKRERWFYTHIADEVRKRGWEYVGQPYKYMYDKKNYFDTDFHLIAKARAVRTQKMIEDLSKSPDAMKYIVTHGD